MSTGKTRLGHINIRSLMPKFQDFKHFIDSEDFDFVGVTKLCVKTGRQEGVALFIRDCYRFTRIENEYTKNENFEQVWVKINLELVRIQGKIPDLRSFLFPRPFSRPSSLIASDSADSSLQQTRLQQQTRLEHGQKPHPPGESIGY
ncbi:hypothetical protein WA026_021059 [Henosepilachna vigintioctopunctata]|uniref:Uncharacterized protein n=1 Tax=Henosepilachna vigintioctopunctata TaxID=420089 RepID=A0AAW1UUR5_9CUCU